ncbi:hypothetical protein WDW37_12490 [Bdellovibrionota bacterium FG-1]
MKHAKNILCLALGLISLAGNTGCSRTKSARPATTARWEKQLQLAVPTVDRHVAENAPKCLKDRINSDFLHQEVARLERERSTGIKNVPKGTWQNKDLASFPAPQAQFLSSQASWIATAGLDFSSCNSLPCILNQVYGDPSGEFGWKIYYFYLATGYPLSCIDLVPDTNISYLSGRPGQITFPLPLRDHLFTDDELRGFWKLSYLLPQNFKFMSAIQRFHRVPNKPDAEGRRYNIPDWNANTCADSWGTSTQGFIRLGRCLEETVEALGVIRYQSDLEPPLNGIGGEFYLVVSHEMTHNLDRFMGGTNTLTQKISDRADWLALSGWHRQTVVTSEGTPVLSDTWVPTPETDGFVNSYAATHPTEDFAETAAWTRFRPDLAKQKSPRKSAFLSKKIFGDRSYDPAGLAQYYEDWSVQTLKPQLLELVNTCLGDHPSLNDLTEPHLTLEGAIPKPLISCLEHNLNEAVTQAFDQLRGVEWEACEQMAAHESAMRTHIFEQLGPDLSRLMAENADRAPFLQAIKNLRRTLKENIDPREGYIHCFQQAQPELCFSRALGEAFDREATPFVGILGSQIAAERADFLGQASFSTTQTTTRQFYTRFFAGTEGLLRTSAELRWKGCLDLAPPTSPLPSLLVQPFSGGGHFVAAELLNCINGAVSNDVTAVYQRQTSRLGLTLSDPDVQALVSELLLPAYLGRLKELELMAATTEDATRDQQKTQVIEVLVSALSKDASWLGDSLGPEIAQARCEPLAQAAFDAYFTKNSDSQKLSVHFASLTSLRTEWSQKACAQAVLSPPIAQVLNERTSRAWTLAQQSLEQNIVAGARDQATECINRNRGNARTSISIRNRRRKCLGASWSEIEARALATWKNTQEGRVFAARNNDVNTYLSAQRSRLQINAIKAMEAR